MINFLEVLKKGTNKKNISELRMMPINFYLKK